MPLDAILRDRAELCLHTPDEPIVVPMRKRPILIPANCDIPKSNLVIRCSVVAGDAVVLQQSPHFSYAAQSEETVTAQFGTENETAFRMNLERAVESVKVGIAACFADMVMRVRTGDAPTATRVNIAVFSQSKALADMHRAGDEIVTSRHISANLPSTLQPKKARERIGFVLHAMREAAYRESGISL